MKIIVFWLSKALGATSACLLDAVKLLDRNDLMRAAE